MARATRLCIAGLVMELLLFYVGSYYCLSRRGFAEADEYGMKGFYLVSIKQGMSNEWWERNHTLLMIYFPLVAIENLLGTGRGPGSEPMRGISR